MGAPTVPLLSHKVAWDGCCHLNHPPNIPYVYGMSMAYYGNPETLGKLTGKLMVNEW